VNDRLHALHTFTALLPLDDVATAAAVLDGWSESPFAAVEGTHFARFVVLDGPRRAAADQPADELGPYLMFSAFFDREADVWLAALPAPTADVFRCCRGYPSEGAATVRAWLHEHRVPATAIFGAYPEATVAEVRDALAFRERFRRFAWEREARRDGLAAFRAWSRS
jgi:hypothetical protein